MMYKFNNTHILGKESRFCFREARLPDEDILESAEHSNGRMYK